MPQEDRYAGAKTFLAKLGFDGAAVDALLVGKVAADTDDGLPVPKPVKKAWQRWSLTGHPDKGGDEEAYNAMKGEYTAFKQNFQAWQQEHPSGHPHFQAWCAASMPASSRGPPSASKQKAELKGKAAAAFEAAQVALAQGRYEDAAAKGAEAKRLSEKAQGMSKVTDKDVRELIEQAIDLIERAEEGVQRDREEAQKRRSQEEAMEAFEALWRAVCAGTLDGGLGWAQKAAAVRECFEDKKRTIKSLETVLGEAEKRHAELAQEAELADQKYRAELEQAAEDKRQISCERDGLAAENIQLKEELNQCLRALEKEESTGSSWWNWDPLGWSKRAKKQLSLPQMITKTTQELKRREAELREKERALTQDLERVKAESEEDLRQLDDRMQQTLRELEIAQHERASATDALAAREDEVKEMQHKLEEERDSTRAARETSASELASAAAALAEREEEVTAMQLKLDEEKAARETAAREHASAAASLAEREEEVTEMQHRLEEEKAAREQDVKDKDERVLTLTGELQSLQDELKSLKSQVPHVKSALLGDIVADRGFGTKSFGRGAVACLDDLDVIGEEQFWEEEWEEEEEMLDDAEGGAWEGEACEREVQTNQQWAGELEAYFTEMQRKSSEAVKFKVRRVGASDPAWRKIVLTPESHDMFQELARRVSKVFGLADEGLFFQYEDEEGDIISVHSNIDIQEAMRQFAPKCPKLTFEGTASDKVVAKAGAPTEKKKDGDEHDTHE